MTTEYKVAPKLQVGQSQLPCGHSTVTMEHVFRGRISKFPPVPTNTLRIYIASTKTDFEYERLKLWTEALPEIQQQVVTFGMDVLFVDVHQGADVIEHAHNRYSFERHLQEIKNCHDTSVGPFFICLLGDKYGPVPLPLTITEDEFINANRQMVATEQDAQMLRDWYVLDSTVTPSVYRLQKIESKFENMSSSGVGCNPSAQSAAHAEWLQIESQLRILLQNSIEACGHNTNRHHFFESAVEQETAVAMGLSPANCFVAIRSLKDLSEDHEDAPKYIDHRDDGEIDTNAGKRLQQFKAKLESQVNDSNIVHFDLTYREEGGFNPHRYHHHHDYLEKLKNEILSWIQNRVMDEYVHSPSREISHEYHAIYREILAHHHLFLRFTETNLLLFKSFRDELFTQLDEVQNDYHQMVLVHGPEGCGKSTFIADFTQRALVRLGKSALLVYRCINPRAMQYSTRTLLVSICMQIGRALDQPIKTLKMLSENRLISHFHQLLRTISKKPVKLLLVIDGIESLHPTIHGDDVTTSWLTSQLPPNVHIYVTSCTGTTTPSTFLRLRHLMEDEESIIELTKLNDNEVMLVLKSWMTSSKRVLTDKQKMSILNLYHDTHTLHLVSVRLRVFENGDDEPLGGASNKSEEVLQRRLEWLEQRHGRHLVEQICRYLTVAKVGLSEVELLDLLSCKNDILLDLFPAALPPVLRFPTTLWQHIRADLEPWLMTCYSNGKMLMCWAHESLDQAVRRRYYHATSSATSARHVESASSKLRSDHLDLVELFLEVWIESKPLQVACRNPEFLGSYGTHCCRFPSLQPLLYSETSYNDRRITELSYHLLVAGGEMGGFKTHTLCNFEYLLAKIDMMSIYEVMSELEQTCRQVLDAELLLIKQCITYAEHNLASDPLQLASELIGRLRQLKEHFPQHIDSLVQQCMEWCDSYSLPLLVPLSSWLPDPRLPLLLSIEGVQVTRLCPTSNGQHIFCATAANEIRQYHVPSKKLIKNLRGQNGRITCLQVSSNNQYLVTGSSNCTLAIWNITTGECVHSVRAHSEGVLCIAMTHDNKTVITGSRDHTVALTSIENGAVIGTKKEHQAAVTSVVINSTDTIFATASRDKMVKLWDMEDLSLLDVMIDTLASPINVLSLTADNTFLLIGCDDKSLHVQSFITGSCIHTLHGHTSKVESIATSRDCIHAVVGCSDGSIHVFNIRSRELLQTLTGHSHAVTDVKLSQDEHFIFSAAKDMLNVWTFHKQHSHDFKQDQHKDFVSCCAIARDDKKAISGGRDNVAKLWNMDICDFSTDLLGHEGAVTCVALADDEAFAVTGSEDCTVKIWSVMMGSIVTDFQQHESCMCWVHVLADNVRVMSAEKAGVIKLWRAEDGESLMSLTAPTHTLTLSPDTHFAISGDDTNSMKLWQVEGGEVIKTLTHTEKISCVCFATDSQLVVTGSADMSLKVWESATGKITQVFAEHESVVSSVAVLGEMEVAVSGDDTGTLLVWSLQTGVVKHKLDGHSARITVVRVTEKGAIAVSGSLDSSIRVWSLHTGSAISSFMMHVPVMDLLITQDATHVVVKAEKNVHLPLMCLHNSPTSDLNSHSQISLHLPTDSPVLPIRCRPSIPHHSATFTVPKYSKSRMSISTIPEIIKVPPIRKTDIQETVKQQEHNKETREQNAQRSFLSRSKKQPTSDDSKICTIL